MGPLPTQGGCIHRPVACALAQGELSICSDVLATHHTHSSLCTTHYRLTVLTTHFQVEDPLAFFRHVKGTSVLPADETFAQIAIWLVCGFSNQSASERTNKYMVEVQGQKKATNLDLEKGRDKLGLRMHLTFKIARLKAHKRDQRNGEVNSPPPLPQYGFYIRECILPAT